MFVVETDDRVYVVREEVLNTFLDELNRSGVQFEEPFETLRFEVRKSEIDWRCE